MKQIMENFRKFLAEGMKMPEDLPEGFGIEVLAENARIYLYTPKMVKG